MAPDPFAEPSADDTVDDIAAGLPAPTFADEAPDEAPDEGAGQDSVAGDEPGDAPAPDPSSLVTIEDELWSDGFVATVQPPPEKYDVAVATESMDGYNSAGRFRCNPGDYLVRPQGGAPDDFVVVAAEEFDNLYERA